MCSDVLSLYALSDDERDESGKVLGCAEVRDDEALTGCQRVGHDDLLGCDEAEQAVQG